MGTALALSTFSILGMVPTPSYLHVLSSRPFCQWWCFSVYRWWATQVGHFLPSDEPKIESPKSDFKALLVMLTCSQCSEVANCELMLSFLGCNKYFLQKAKSHNHVLWFLLFSAEIILCKSHCGSSSAVSLEFSHVCWIRDSSQVHCFYGVTELYSNQANNTPCQWLHHSFCHSMLTQGFM